MSELLQNAAHLVQGTAHMPLSDIGGALTPGQVVPTPGGGTPPPGFRKLEAMLSWMAWIVFGLCVAGVLIVAGRMAIKHQSGQGGAHASSLVWVLTACILAASASLLVTGILSVQE
ncbi:hypothetical protein [Actinomadura vinacea]